MSRGFASAARMASGVISWNTSRRTVTCGGGERTSSRCQAIASPSRSSSVARYNSSTEATSFLSDATAFFLALSSTYSGLKSLSTSIPSRAQGSAWYALGISSAFVGRSRTWPRDDSTV